MLGLIGLIRRFESILHSQRDLEFDLAALTDLATCWSLAGMERRHSEHLNQIIKAKSIVVSMLLDTMIHQN